MPVKIRLARRGRKFATIFNIVVADSRAPRDGKFIEELGQYNPNTNPATITLDFDKALDWLQKGAQPTDTCRAILSYKGVLYKKHLLEGVKKGAFDEAEAEKRFQTWMKEKEAKIQAKVDKLASDKDSAAKSRLAAESKIKEERAAEIAKMRSELIEKEAEAAKAEEVAEEAPAEEATEVPVEDTPAAEEAQVEESAAEETSAEEKVEEAPAEEPKAEEKAEEKEEEKKEEAPAEEPVAEKKEEAPAEEKAEEAPVEEPKEEAPVAEEEPAKEEEKAEEPKAEDQSAEEDKE